MAKVDKNQKYNILLIDVGYPQKPDKLIRKSYLSKTAMEKGKELCKEYDYETFKIIPTEK